MKRFFGLVCAAMLTISASAQVTWNVKAGAGLSWAPISLSGSGLDYSASSKSHFVGKLGVGIEAPITQNFSVMPSLELALKGAKYEYSDEEKPSNLNLTYVQLPVMAAYRFSLNDRLNMTLKAGPYFAYALSGKMDDGEEKWSIFNKEEMEGDPASRFDAGIIAGVDFEYHRFVVGVEYEHGLTNMYESKFESVKTSIKKSAAIKNSAAYITVGYKF